MSTTDTLDDDHPLFLVNEQIKGLLEGDGASEDHGDVLTFLRNTGLPEGTVARMHKAIVCAENNTRWPILSDGHLRAICFAYEKGYAAGLDERNTCNVFGASGSQAAAFDVGLECGRAARSRVKPEPSMPDGVAEALQRLIENGAVLGPASSEDALLVARYRQRLLASAPSVPIDSIGKLLTQVMDVAVANGANSVSMPDELVEVAAWLSGVQPAPSFADAYQGAMEESAIWKKRALEAEDLNRKFLAEINSPTHLGEPALAAAQRASNESDEESKTP